MTADNSSTKVLRKLWGAFLTLRTARDLAPARDALQIQSILHHVARVADDERARLAPKVHVHFKPAALSTTVPVTVENRLQYAFQLLRAARDDAHPGLAENIQFSMRRLAAIMGQPPSTPDKKLPASLLLPVEDMGFVEAVNIYTRISKALRLNSALKIENRTAYLCHSLAIVRKFPEFLWEPETAAITASVYEGSALRMRHKSNSVFPHAILERVIGGYLDVMGRHIESMGAAPRFPAFVQSIRMIERAPRYKGIKHIPLTPGFLMNIRTFLVRYDATYPKIVEPAKAEPEQVAHIPQWKIMQQRYANLLNIFLKQRSGSVDMLSLTARYYALSLKYHLSRDTPPSGQRKWVDLIAFAATYLFDQGENTKVIVLRAALRRVAADPTKFGFGDKEKRTAQAALQIIGERHVPARPATGHSMRPYTGRSPD